MENEELIRQKMEHTRESLTDKLETLEDKLLSSVHQATSAVTETVASVKETVSESVESVKDAVDIPAHVDRHPWLALGGSVLCGYMLGNMFGGAKESRQRPAAPGSQAQLGNQRHAPVPWFPRSGVGTKRSHAGAWERGLHRGAGLPTRESWRLGVASSRSSPQFVMVRSPECVAARLKRAPPHNELD
jgi:ElaB/YqjD/DUF883 family membrane-anchored ribosome-binding protein